MASADTLATPSTATSTVWAVMSRWVTMRNLRPPGYETLTPSWASLLMNSGTEPNAGLELDEDYVGLETPRINTDALNLGQARGEPVGIGVVIGKAVDHGLEGHYSRCRENSCLPHPSSHHLSPLPGSVDELLGATEEGAHGSAQTFRETKGYVVRVLDKLLGGRF